MATNQSRLGAHPRGFRHSCLGGHTSVAVTLCNDFVHGKSKGLLQPKSVTKARGMREPA